MDNDVPAAADEAAEDRLGLKVKEKKMLKVNFDLFKKGLPD